jgi:DNA-binding MarR family transcriptional regulator
VADKYCEVQREHRDADREAPRVMAPLSRLNSMAKQFERQTIEGGQLVGLVSELIRAEHRHAAFLAQHQELPSADTLALYHLADRPLKSSELGDRLGLTAGSVTALVDRLIARNLVRRRPHERDRRVVLVEMTESGRAETWDALQHFIGDVIAMSQARPAKEGAVIANFLRELIDVVDRDTERLKGAR